MDNNVQTILCGKCLWKAMRASNMQCAFHDCVFSETGVVEVVDGLSCESFVDRISGKKVLIPENLIRERSNNNE